jgi:radical SAM superfamily enzyme YgiQ (UPF0313 family)
VLRKHGFDVKIIDVMVEPNYRKRIMQEARDALAVGIGVWTSEIASAYEITKLIKNNFKVPIVWGSWHPTLFPQQTVESSLIDYVIVNEGEYSFLELARVLSGRKKQGVVNIPGLAYKKNGKVRFNPRAGFVDLDSLPEPDYSLVDIKKYVDERVSNRMRRALPYESSRGCPHRCAFCINVVAGNRTYRTKSVKKTLDEIENLVKKYNLDYLFFQEDNFFVSKERVKEICRGIIKRKIKLEWFAECRADYFKPGHISTKILKLAKKAGLHSLSIGAESGSPLSLRQVKKDITVEQTLNAAKICNEVGIIPTFSFMIGLPHERLSESYKTVDLALKTARLCPNSGFSIGTFFPYPRCELVEELIKEGLFREPETLEEWLDERYMRLYTEIYYYPPGRKSQGC